MGWSDFTELHRRQHILNLVEDIMFSRKLVVWQGYTGMIFLHELTLKLVYLF